MNIAPIPSMPETSALPAVKPPLKWAGGKRWLVPYLRPLWRQHAWRRLVEPFCGGLAVSLELRPQTALLNDANPHLINFYTWLQEGLTVNLPMQNESRLYYWYRGASTAWSPMANLTSGASRGRSQSITQ